MKSILLALVLLIAPRIVLAEDTAKAGAEAMIPADQRIEKVLQFDPSLAPITIVTTKALAREPKLPADEPKYQKFYEEADVYMAYAIDVKLKADDKDYHVVRCDSGGSNDPECVFSLSQDPEKEGVAIPGLVFVVPGDGCVYSGGHTNNMFSARALHCATDGMLKEVAQPFSYAGFQSKALREIKLYAGQNSGQVVTTIAPGAFVEVVLQDGDHFLVRDGFGLTGWAKVEQAQQATDIDGLYYNGD
jgi:hypothetical protein